MMGRTHAATGALVGVVAAGLTGGGLAELAVGCVLGAGAALAPDVDHPASAASRSAGVVSGWVCAGVRAASSAVWRATRRPGDDGGHADGTGAHRHLTHTPLVAVAAGVLAGLVAAWPVGCGVVAGLAVAVGLRGAGWRGGLSRWVVALLAGVAAALASPGPLVVGAAVAAGWAAHIAGDWLTPAGVPLAWPVAHRGKRWWMWRSPVAFRAGDCWQETCVRWGCWVGTPTLALWAAVG